MADPAWGATSLSDEETAQALCSFQHADLVPTSRRWPHQIGRQESLYKPCSDDHEMPHLTASANGLSNFGYPTHATYFMMPVSVPRDTRGDYYTIQEQLDQQQWHIQTQREYIRAQTQIKRIQQHRYSIAVDELNQTKRNRGDNIVYEPLKRLPSDGDSAKKDSVLQCGLQTQQSIQSQVVSHQVQNSPPRNLLIDTFREKSRQEEFRSGNDGNFASQLLSQSKSFDRNRKVDTQEFIPQESQQPRPFYPTNTTDCKHQVIPALRTTCTSRPDDQFLNGIIKHFNTDSRTSADNYSSNARHNEAHDDNAVLGFTSTETPVQSTIDQHNRSSRPALAPSGAAVVPGISLTSRSTRPVTMRDLLNGDDGSSKMEAFDPSRQNKLKRAFPSHKITQKDPVKHRKHPQQLNERKFDTSTDSTQSAVISNILSASRNSTEASERVSAFHSPMYRAFLKSRAERVSKQVNHSSIRVIPTAHYSQRQQNVLKSASSSIQVRYPNQSMDSITKRPQIDEVKVNTSSISSQQLTAPDASSLDHNFGRKSHDGIITKELQRNGKQHILLANELSLADNNTRHLTVGNARPPVKQDVVGMDSSDSSCETRQNRNLPLLDLVSSSARDVCEQLGHENLNKNTLGALGSSATTASTSSTLASFPGLPHGENRTVIIFCKRDFMRYQAVKIWRKYQEQLKKHDEWREVRVAGKRTRYLKSRCNDERQRIHRRSFKRSGKSHRKASKRDIETPTDNAQLAFANSTRLDSTTPWCTQADRLNDEKIYSNREIDQASDTKSPVSESPAKSMSETSIGTDKVSLVEAGS